MQAMYCCACRMNSKIYSSNGCKRMNRIYDLRGGKAYDSTFGVRMRDTGQYADLLAQRFRLAMKKTGIPRFTTV